VHNRVCNRLVNLRLDQVANLQEYLQVNRLPDPPVNPVLDRLVNQQDNPPGNPAVIHRDNQRLVLVDNQLPIRVVNQVLFLLVNPHGNRLELLLSSPVPDQLVSRAHIQVVNQLELLPVNPAPDPPVNQLRARLVNQHDNR
jgi:hypothetical protein